MTTSALALSISTKSYPRLNADCLNQIFYLLKDEFSTLFKLLTVSKSFFCSIVPILYRDPYRTLQPTQTLCTFNEEHVVRDLFAVGKTCFTDQQQDQLTYLLGRCNGLFKAIYTAADYEEGLTELFSLPVPTINYFNHVQYLPCQPIDDHGTPIQDSLALQIQYCGSRYHRIRIGYSCLEMVTKLVGTLKSLERVKFDSHPIQGFAVEEHEQELMIQFVTTHRQLFPGVLKRVMVEQQTLNSELYIRLQAALGLPVELHITDCSKDVLEQLPELSRLKKIEFRQSKSSPSSSSSSSLSSSPVSSLSSLSLSSDTTVLSKKQPGQIGSWLCKNHSHAQLLDSIRIQGGGCNDDKDLFAWARKDQETISAQLQQPLQRQEERGLLQKRSNDNAKIKHLDLSAVPLVAIKDALSGFRTSLVDLKVLNKSASSRNDSNSDSENGDSNDAHLVWNWDMPRLEQISYLGGATFVVSSLSHCPNLTVLELSGIRQQQPRKPVVRKSVCQEIDAPWGLTDSVAGLRQVVLRGKFSNSFQLESIQHLSRLESLELYEPLADHDGMLVGELPEPVSLEQVQNWKPLRKLKTLHLRGWWAVRYQMSLITITPNIECFVLSSKLASPPSLDLSNMRLATAATDAALIATAAAMTIPSAPSTPTRFNLPSLAHLYFSEFTISTKEDKIFLENLFLSTTAGSITAGFPNLKQLSLHDIQGMEYSSLVPRLMQKSGLLALSIRAGNDSGLNLDLTAMEPFDLTEVADQWSPRHHDCILSYEEALHVLKKEK